MRDGARDALCGYLYQFLHVAALQAAATLHVPKKGSHEDLENLGCKLIADVKKGKLIHEQFGQDAVVCIDDSDSDETLAIQFKSSRSSTRAEMDMGELVEILRSFDASQREASREGRSIDRFVLVTSKSLDATARMAVQKRHDLRCPTQLSTRIKKSLSWVRKDYESRPDALNALHKTFGKMDEPIENASFESSVRHIETYARRLGLKEDETQKGIGNIIAEMLDRTSRGLLPITREWLNECLAGASDARVLHLASQGHTTRAAGTERLSDELLRQLQASPGELIQRERLKKVREEAERFPIVFLIGHGGCGKTALALQYLLEESRRKLVMMLPASGAARDDCIGLELRRLRSAGFDHRLPIDSIETVIDRLRLANEEAEPPYLLVDLDGLDEVAEEVRRGVRDVIDQLWTRESGRAPYAILLLTCRASSRDPRRAFAEVISTWVQTDYPQMVEDRVGKVFIGDFDDQELQSAAGKLGSDDLARIGSMTSTSPDDGWGHDTLGDPISQGTSKVPRLLHIVRSLKHPAMWGIFAKLDSVSRSRVLEGRSEDLHTLARHFLVRFCGKANQRRPSLTSDSILAGLRQVVAAGSPGNPPRDRQTDWVLPMRGPLADLSADLLYNEALSYGLIEEDQAKWRWRHTLVYDYLGAEEGT